MSQGARILVVDDEPQIRRSLQVNLEGKGYAVVTAESAEQALQATANRVPDVIVLDLLMPGMDGMELTRKIREQSTEYGSYLEIPDDGGLFRASAFTLAMWFWPTRLSGWRTLAAKASSMGSSAESARSRSLVVRYHSIRRRRTSWSKRRL